MRGSMLGSVAIAARGREAQCSGWSLEPGLEATGSGTVQDHPACDAFQHQVGRQLRALARQRGDSL
jgi:hypothetical protein